MIINFRVRDNCFEADIDGSGFVTLGIWCEHKPEYDDVVVAQTVMENAIKVFCGRVLGEDINIVVNHVTL